MLAILAHRGDTVAQALVERWADHDARLLSPEDLSVEGWRYRPGDVVSSTAMVGQERVACRDLDAALTRLPWVFEQDLPYIVPEDRSYVAAEMSAFLLAWLSELQCPVVNRPTPNCLAGPLWRRERWAQVAVNLGISVAPVPRRVISLDGASAAADAAGATPHGAALTVVGNAVIGAAPDELASHARTLARAAQADLLVVQFDGFDRDARFVSASPWPDLAEPAVAAAVLARLGIRCRPR